MSPSSNKFLRYFFRSVFIGLILLASLSVEAQQNKFVITGKFKIDGGSNSDAKISIEKNGKTVSTVDGTARFEIPLDFDAIYVVSFEKEGFVTKRLRFDTHVPSGRAEAGFYPFDFTVEIFEQYDDVNLVVFNQPVGQIAYDDVIDEFNYDTDYTKSIQTQLEQALEEVAEAKEEKLKEQAEQKKQEEVVNKQVSTLTSSASKNLSSGKTEEAIKNLQEALKLKEDPAIAQQLKDAETKLANDNQKKEQETALNNKITEAETALKAGDLEKAKDLYVEANGIMGSDPRVTKQLENINKMIQDKNANEQKINQLIKEAEDALAANNPTLARDKATEAAKLGEAAKSNDILNRANESIKNNELAAKAEQEKQTSLNNAIAEVEKALKANDLDLANQKLEFAKGIIDSDPRIKSLETSINEKKQQQAQAEADKEKKIADLNKQANDALSSSNIDAAKTAANELKALGANSAADNILAKIASMEKEAADQKAAADAQQKKIEGLFAEAEKALKANDLNTAQAKVDEIKTAGGSDKIGDLQSRIDSAKNAEKAAQEAENAKQAEFDAAIADGNSKLSSGDIDGAKAALEKAKAIKENEQSKALAKSIDDTIKAYESKAAAEKAAADEALKKQQALLSEVERALKSNDLDGAQSKLNEAKNEGASEGVNELQSKIDEAKNAQLAALDAEKSKQAEFDAAIADGNSKLSSGDIDGAKVALEKAKSISDNESTKSLAKAIEDEEKKRSSMAKAEAERDAKKSALIADIEKSISSNKLEDAKSGIDQLKSLAPGDANILRLETLISEKEEEKAQNAEKQATIASLVNQGNAKLSENDFPGAESIVNELNNLGATSEAKNLKTSIDTRQSELAKAENSEKELQSQIAEMVSEAQGYLDAGDAKNLKKAIDNLNAKAPDNSAIAALQNGLTALEKKASEDAKLADDKAAQAKTKQEYDSLIEKADKLLAKSDFDAAEISYKEAKNIKADENYPDQKLAEIEQLRKKQAEDAARLASENDEAARQKNFEAEMQKAVKAVAKKDYLEAESAYNNAIAISPDNALAQAGLDEVRKLIAEQKNAEDAAEKTALEAKQKAELQAQFDDLMKSGQKAFDNAEFTSAIDFAEKASNLGVDNATATSLKDKSQVELDKQNAQKSEEESSAQLKKYLAQANSSLQSGELDLADQQFDLALSIEKDNKIALSGKEKVAAKRKENEELAAKNAELEARKIDAKFNSLVNQGNAAKTAKRWLDAIEKYEEALKLKADNKVQADLDLSKAELEKQKTAEEQKAREAADALANNRPREREVLTQIIEEESGKSNPTNNSGTAQPQGGQDKRPTTSAVAVLGDIKSGDAARKASPAAKMSEEDKYDAQQAAVSKQQEELALVDKQRQLKEKYKERKTVETETVGNSKVTYVYINRGEYVTVFKKVEHNWGGVFYFVDDRSTNQRYWEFSTK